MMKMLSWNIVILLVVLLLSACSPSQQVFTNGEIYTASQNVPWAEVVVVEDGIISYAGDSDGAKSIIRDDAIVYDLQGRLLMPGFIDSHVHTFVNAIFSRYDSLENAKSHEEVLQAIKEYASNNNDDWLFVTGLHMGLYDESVDLLKEELDEIESDKPVLIVTSDLHSMWLNSKALEKYGFTITSKDIPGGVIRRDENNVPTGIITDKVASDLLARLPFSKVEVVKGYMKTFSEMSSFGYTGFMEAYVNDSQVSKLLWYFDLLGKLDFRTSLAIYYDQGLSLSDVIDQIDEFRAYQTDKIKIDTVKIIVDGATLPEIYNDQPLKNKEIYPHSLVPKNDLNKVVTYLSKENISVHMHTVGNQATSIALDAIELARDEYPYSKSIYSVTHIFAAHESSAKRFRELGVIANYQPNFFNPNWTFLDMWKSSMSEEILKKSLPTRDFFEAGVTIAASTDFPVQPSNNPFHAIEVGITRDDPISPTGNPFMEDQAIGVGAWIDAFTINAAKQLKIDDQTGSIEVGKLADLIVVDQNVFEVAPNDISDSQVIMTMFGGEIVYRKSVLVRD